MKLNKSQVKIISEIKRLYTLSKIKRSLNEEKEFLQLKSWYYGIDLYE